MSHRRINVKIFLELLLRLRAEEDSIRTNGDMKSSAGSTMGTMLDQAALYGCSKEIIGNDGGTPVHRRHRKKISELEYMKVRDDSARWRRAGASPKMRDGWLLATLENIWASLTPLQRIVMLYGREMTIADVVTRLRLNHETRTNGRQITHSFVVWTMQQASRIIEGHSLFRSLGSFSIPLEDL